MGKDGPRQRPEVSASCLVFFTTLSHRMDLGLGWETLLFENWAEHARESASFGSRLG